MKYTSILHSQHRCFWFEFSFCKTIKTISNFCRISILQIFATWSTMVNLIISLLQYRPVPRFHQVRPLHLHYSLSHLLNPHHVESSPQSCLILLLADSSLLCEKYPLRAQHLGAEGVPLASQLTDFYMACASVLHYRRHVQHVCHFEEIRPSRYFPSHSNM